MIEDWRTKWNEGDFPFLFVQLANFMPSPLQPAESDWAELREAQLMTLKNPKTGMAVTIDIGDVNDIHPTNKQEVGRRLALTADKIAYGKDLVYSGPLYDSMLIKGNTIRIHFTNTGTGLMTPDNKILKGFAIAGKDRKFYWAEATIDGDYIMMKSSKVKNPVAVRYGWASSPDCNLYNKEGLPASPFRTDDWPGVTIKNE
jgi:sialate O-acetylesterase